MLPSARVEPPTSVEQVVQQPRRLHLLPCQILCYRCKQLMEILPTGVGAVYRLLKLLNQVRGSVQLLVGCISC